MTEMAIRTLLGLMAALRDPTRGCSWDCAQTSTTLASYVIEEAYEVVDAIESGDPDALRDELGDLLLQVVFHARIAEEAGTFAFEDVADAISAKLIRRHPHVFGADGQLLANDTARLDTAAVEAQWRAIKSTERSAGASPPPLADVARALPALMRAEKISANAARHGFDWPSPAEVIAKIREETSEVEQALAGGGREELTEEIGDLLFAVSNLARHAGIDPEAALRAGNDKFVRRFTDMAARLETGGGLGTSSLSSMEAAWAAVKRVERGEGED